MANNVDQDQTAPKGAVCSGSTLFASMLNLSVMLGNYLQQRLQQTTFSDAFFLGALRVNIFLKFSVNTCGHKRFVFYTQVSNTTQVTGI